MRKIIKKLARIAGLEKPAHAAWMTMKAKGLTPWVPLVPEDDFRRCVQAAIRSLDLSGDPAAFGDYLEFGVSRGSSLACVHKVLSEAGMTQARLIGFDSFEGMPSGSEAEGWTEGDFRSTLPATKRHLASKGVNLNRVELVKGWFDDTLNDGTRDRLNLSRAGLIMIDCDIYSASKQALEFCEPFIGEQAVIMFDDWGWAERMGKTGQKEAFAEFLAAHPSLKANEIMGYNASSRIFHVRREAVAAKARKRTRKAMPACVLAMAIPMAAGAELLEALPV
ncbi:MAG: TylF/MycF/NovP-related O-methyltransferase [Sphingobium phenoxybenzoativorans]